MHLGACKYMHLRTCKYMHQDTCKYMHLGTCKYMHLGTCKYMHLGTCKYMYLGTSKCKALFWTIGMFLWDRGAVFLGHPIPTLVHALSVGQSVSHRERDR